MRFKLFALISAISLMLPLTGCVSIKTRLEDRPRVDQELPDGAEAMYPDRAKTRKVFVVEIDEKNKQGAESKAAKTVAQPAGKAEKSTEGESKVVTESKETVVVHDSNFTFPKMTAGTLAQPQTSTTTAVEQYVIQKDDTLQKIAKKLYGSYSKWTIIYDANRDVIKDPNVLKPGKTLKIPVQAVAAQPAEPVAPETSVDNIPNTEQK